MVQGSATPVRPCNAKPSPEAVSTTFAISLAARMQHLTP